MKCISCKRSKNNNGNCDMRYSKENCFLYVDKNKEGIDYSHLFGMGKNAKRVDNSPRNYQLK